METAEAVQQAVDYMEAHLCERIEPELIAAAAYMSLPHLYRVFYALTGHPLTEYVRKRRVHQAALALRQSDKQVLAVAFDCGFESYRTFAGVFKKFTGLTPGMYRRADTYFSFERINVLERVRYTEDRELSRLYPDVQVIRMAPLKALAYRHAAPVREGLEDEAFRLFYDMLKTCGFPTENTQLLGFEPEPASGGPYGEYAYVMATPFNENMPLSHPHVSVITLPGGLYAAGRAPAGPAPSIIGAWNRLLAEWLPRSSFRLGKQPFIEEFLHHHGTVTRLKLFLPAERRQQQEAISIAKLAPCRLLAFRADGPHARSAADDELSAWLMNRGVSAGAQHRLFMSCSYGAAEDEENWYELGLSVPDHWPLQSEDESRVKWLDGGLYASITTAAYGIMTGVLDLLHEWLCQSKDYDLDEERLWMAEYAAGEGLDMDRSTTVTCYLPVIPAGSRAGCDGA